MRLAVLFGDLGRDAAVVPGVSLGELDRTSFEQLEAALAQLAELEVVYLRSHARLIDDLRALRGEVDLVLNLCDEGYGNDLARELHVPALLDLLGLPYTGAAPRCLACCFDKALVRSVAVDLGVPVARGELHAAGARVARPGFGFPAIVKPNFGDGSFGITIRSVVSDDDALAVAVGELQEVHRYRGPILVEEYLPGPDLDVGVVGDGRGGWTFLPMSTIDHAAVADGVPHIASHELKWSERSVFDDSVVTAAALPAEVVAAIRGWSERLLDRFEVRDYARLDWRLDGSGAPRLLEINPNTGWGASGRLADMAAMAGWSYPALLRAIVRSAAGRLGTPP